MRTFFFVFMSSFFGWVGFVHATPENNKTVYTYSAAQHTASSRGRWHNKLIRLALDNTIKEYGSYQLNKAPQMNHRRALESTKYQKYPNFFIVAVHSDELAAEEGIQAIPFPVELGMLGYRVCLYSKTDPVPVQKRLNPSMVRTLMHGQVRDWMDVLILRHNGYVVTEVDDFASLPKMASLRRIDLLCRGVHEVYDEWGKGLYKDLILDNTLAFQYDIPVFMYAHQSQKHLIDRLTLGLQRTYHDGSLKRMFLAHYQDNMAFSKLGDRDVIPLANPFLKILPKAYVKYRLKPSEF